MTTSTRSDKELAELLRFYMKLAATCERQLRCRGFQVAVPVEGEVTIRKTETVVTEL